MESVSNSWQPAEIYPGSSFKIIDDDRGSHLDDPIHEGGIRLVDEAPPK